MDGWTGQILRVNLTTRTRRIEPFSEEFAHSWIGGRVFAVKILSAELAPGIDPLGPENKLVVAVGPISGISAPNTGKTVGAAKRPMNGSHGGGTPGTTATAQPAESVGPYAGVRRMGGRSAGRPGMGAVMGSKLLKAIVVKGSKPIPQAFPAKMKELGRDDLREVHRIDKEAGWSLQGTTGVLPWCNEVAALPVHNFRGTHHPDAWQVDGQRLGEAKGAVYGWPRS